jgi:hypothetical protein
VPPVHGNWRLWERSFTGHSERAERSKNLINCGKPEILHFVQDDKMVFGRGFKQGFVKVV